MDFDRVPEPAFLRLLEFLPITDRLRVGRVSQKFRHLSLIAVSRTRSLDFGDKNLFGKITHDDAIDLLNECSDSLRVLKFDEGEFASIIFSAGLTFGRLIELNLGRSELSNEEFTRIIGDHSSTLERTSWTNWTTQQAEVDDEEGHNNNSGQFRKIRLSNDGVIFAHLQHLELRYLESCGIGSLINRVPNLVSLKFTLASCSTDMFDQFLVTVPQLRSLDVSLEDDRLELKKSRRLFELPSLISLKVQHGEQCLLTNYFDDETVRQILDSCPNMEELSLYLDNLSEVGLKMLKGLTRLRHLTCHTLDDTVQKMRFAIDCPNLEIMEMNNYTVSEHRLGVIFRKLPNLRRIIFRGIPGVRTSDEAAEMLSRLGNSCHVSRIIITLVFFVAYNGDQRKYSRIWATDAVNRALVQTKDRNGLGIRIEKIIQPHMGQEDAQENSELDDELEAEEESSDEEQK